jgi:L-tartrate/succinate antiporter
MMVHNGYRTESSRRRPWLVFPAMIAALAVCYTLDLMGIISPYATGPGPIYYGSGYVSRKDFWRLGLIFGAIYLTVLLVIGVPYLRYYLG